MLAIIQNAKEQNIRTAQTSEDTISLAFAKSAPVGVRKNDANVLSGPRTILKSTDHGTLRRQVTSGVFSVVFDFPGWVMSQKL